MIGYAGDSSDEPEEYLLYPFGSGEPIVAWLRVDREAASKGPPQVGGTLVLDGYIPFQITKIDGFRLDVEPIPFHDFVTAESQP